MMKRYLLPTLAALFTFAAAPAFALTCSNTTPQLKDNAATTFNAPYVDDGTGSGACEPQIQLKQGGNIQTINSNNSALIDANTASQIHTDLTAPIAAGTNIIGKAGIDQTTPGTTNAVTLTPQAASGLTTFFVQPAASDNHTNIKNGAGNVYYILAMNNSGTVNYLRFYNAATGFNGCGSATNLVTQIQIPASTSVGGISVPLPYPINFSTGISICVTSGYATTDTTNATASAMSLTIGYN